MSYSRTTTTTPEDDTTRSSTVTTTTTPRTEDEVIVVLSNLRRPLPSSWKRLEYVSKVLTVEGSAPNMALLHVGTSTNDDDWIPIETTRENERDVDNGDDDVRRRATYAERHVWRSVIGVCTTLPNQEVV